MKHLSPEEAYESTKNKKGYKSFYQCAIKRTIDIVLSIIALPFLLLITIPVAIAIKLDDRGPVFYLSYRLGVGGKEFGMVKYRSMKVDSPFLTNADGSTFNSKTDSRVTKIGRFLRETSLDEIPQVLNILAGHMSIIGPRPGDVESKDTYREDEKDKLLVRPGLTGYTQAYFRNNIGVRDKRLLDAWYAHNVTFLWDIKIFFKTIQTVFSHENIYTNVSESDDESVSVSR